MCVLFKLLCKFVKNVLSRIYKHMRAVRNFSSAWVREHCTASSQTPRSTAVRHCTRCVQALARVHSTDSTVPYKRRMSNWKRDTGFGSTTGSSSHNWGIITSENSSLGSKTMSFGLLIFSSTLPCSQSSYSHYESSIFPTSSHLDLSLPILLTVTGLHSVLLFTVLSLSILTISRPIHLILRAVMNLNISACLANLFPH